MKRNHSPTLPKKISRIRTKKVYADSAEQVCTGFGYGLFARTNIKKGETLFIIKGKKVPVKINSPKDSEELPNAIGVDKGVWIDPKVTNPLVYLNHSCDPNSGIKGTVTIVALKQIKKGEHITIDYSITEGDKYWRLAGKCKCGAKNCRGTIRSIHYLPKRIYVKYMPYIPQFLQKEYVNSVQ